MWVLLKRESSSQTRVHSCVLSIDSHLFSGYREKAWENCSIRWNQTLFDSGNQRIGGNYDNRGAKILPRIHHLRTKTNWNSRVRRIKIRNILPIFRQFCLEKSTGFLVLHSTLFQHHHVNVTNRMTFTRSVCRQHLSFWPHCIVLWLFFRTSHKWSSR